VSIRSCIAFGLLASFGALACQRSPAYRRDQGYYEPEHGSYYDRAKSSTTQKVASLGQPKKRVVILNFWNDTPVKQADLGLFAADELRRGLFLSRHVILPTDIRTDLSTENFVNGDSVRVAQLIREGRKLGVSVLGIGRVTRVAFRQRGDDVGLFSKKQSIAAVDVEVKLFDVQGGREIMAIGKSGEASSDTMSALESSDIESAEYRGELTKMALRHAMTLITPEIVRSVDKLTWQGTIAKIVGSKIYVNAGKSSGLVAGDILRVMTQGDDLYDPQTGAYLGRTQGQLKGTLEVVDFIGTDGAVSEIHTGANFQEGDIVELY
jgi:hypothetical protein